MDKKQVEELESFSLKKEASLCKRKFLQNLGALFTMCQMYVRRNFQLKSNLKVILQYPSIKPGINISEDNICLIQFPLASFL